VSAFCNAGFSLHCNNLTPFRSDPLFLGVIEAQVILGGLGFLRVAQPHHDQVLAAQPQNARRVTLHSKIALKATLVLIAVGALAFLAC
jgi:trk system potassium uptake protein TrkH